MRALHVVGIDFELGLGIGGGGAAEQHRLHGLARISLLRMPCDRDLAEIRPRRPPAKHRADDLVRGGIGFDMVEHSDDLERLLSTAKHRRAEFEMRAFVARHIDRHAAELTAGVEHVEGRGRAFAQDHPVIADRDGIDGDVLHDDAGEGLPRRYLNQLGRWHRPDRGHRLQIGVAPRLIAPCRDGKAHAATPAYPSRSSSSASSAPPDRTIRPPLSTCTKSGAT